MRYEQANLVWHILKTADGSERFTAFDIYVYNGRVPECPKSEDYHNASFSIYIDERTKLVATVRHGAKNTTHQGWSIWFEDMDAAIEAYAEPGGVFWVRPNMGATEHHEHECARRDDLVNKFSQLTDDFDLKWMPKK